MESMNHLLIMALIIGIGAALMWIWKNHSTTTMRDYMLITEALTRSYPINKRISSMAYYLFYRFNLKPDAKITLKIKKALQEAYLEVVSDPDMRFPKNIVLLSELNQMIKDEDVQLRQLFYTDILQYIIEHYSINLNGQFRTYLNNHQKTLSYVELDEIRDGLWKSSGTYSALNLNLLITGSDRDDVHAELTSLMKERMEKDINYLLINGKGDQFETLVEYYKNPLLDQGPVENQLKERLIAFRDEYKTKVTDPVDGKLSRARLGILEEIGILAEEAAHA